MAKRTPKWRIVTLDNGNEYAYLSDSKQQATSCWTRAVVSIRYASAREIEVYETKRQNVIATIPRAMRDDTDIHRHN